MITNRDLDVIALRGLAIPAPIARDRRRGPGVGAPALEATHEYVLVREGAPHSEGWWLRCRRAGRVLWSTPLAPRGAAPGVRPTVAQAVAVRVLTEHGVFVSGWNQLDADQGEADQGEAEGFLARQPRGASIAPA